MVLNIITLCMKINNTYLKKMKQNGTNLMFMLIIYGKTQRNFEKKTSVFACESCNQTAIKPKTQT